MTNKEREIIMSNEIKAVSFRLGEEEIQKFREFAEEQGMNQAEMFQALLNNFEVARAKNSFSDRAKEIETFQVTVNTLVNMFINSLSINQTSEERIRETLSSELSSKDKIIAELQLREATIKEEWEMINKRCENQMKELARLTTETEIYRKDIMQKDKAITDYQAQVNLINETVAECRLFKDGYKGLEVQVTELSKQLTDAQNENANLVAQNQNLEDMKSFYMNQAESFKDAERAARRLLSSHNTQMNELKAEQFEEIKKVREELEAKFAIDLKERVEFEKAKMQLELDKALNREQMLQTKLEELENKAKKSAPKTKAGTKIVSKE